MNIKEKISKALLDPACVFASPGDVLKEKDITHEQKIAILLQWEYDARLLEIAEEENMKATDQTTTLDDILAALNELGYSHQAK